MTWLDRLPDEATWRRSVANDAGLDASAMHALANAGEHVLVLLAAACTRQRQQAVRTLRLRGPMHLPSAQAAHACLAECARICLTHSFPIKQTDAFASPWDCPAEDRRFVQAYLDRVEYTAYDRLIQLCDALALPSGPCLMEKRLLDVGCATATSTT